jgi:hypothetical protein
VSELANAAELEEPASDPKRNTARSITKLVQTTAEEMAAETIQASVLNKVRVTDVVALQAVKMQAK